MRHWPAMTGRECLIDLGVIGAPVEPRNVDRRREEVWRRAGLSRNGHSKTGSGAHLARSEGLEPPNLLTRRFPYQHPDLFRSVRHLGQVAARCPCESGTPRGCSLWWLPAWLPRPNRISGVPHCYQGVGVSTCGAR